MVLTTPDSPVADPFVITTGPECLRPSANANAFSPIGLPGNSFGGAPGQARVHGPRSIGQLAIVSKPVHQGIGDGRQMMMGAEHSSPAAFGPVGGPQFNFPGANRVPHDAERRGRAFMLENVPKDMSYMSIAGFFNVSFPPSRSLL